MLLCFQSSPSMSNNLLISLLSQQDLVNLLWMCVDGYEWVTTYHRRAFKIRVFLSPFFEDVTAFHALQLTTGLIIAENGALQFLGRSTQTSDDLELCNHGSEEPINTVDGWTVLSTCRNFGLFWIFGYGPQFVGDKQMWVLPLTKGVPLPKDCLQINSWEAVYSTCVDGMKFLYTSVLNSLKLYNGFVFADKETASLAHWYMTSIPSRLPSTYVTSPLFSCMVLTCYRVHKESLLTLIEQHRNRPVLRAVVLLWVAC